MHLNTSKQSGIGYIAWEVCQTRVTFFPSVVLLTYIGIHDLFNQEHIKEYHQSIRRYSSHNSTKQLHQHQ